MIVKKLRDIVLRRRKKRMFRNTPENDYKKWIEEAISKRHIKYYDYKHFRNLHKIGNGAFGKIYRANWKNSEDLY
jgi:hypothetical protein